MLEAVLGFHIYSHLFPTTPICACVCVCGSSCDRATTDKVTPTAATFVWEDGWKGRVGWEMGNIM